MFEANCLVVKGVCKDTSEVMKVGSSVRRIFTIEVKDEKGKVMTIAPFYIKTKKMNDFYEDRINEKEIRFAGCLKTVHEGLYLEAENLEVREVRND